MRVPPTRRAVISPSTSVALRRLSYDSSMRIRGCTLLIALLACLNAMPAGAQAAGQPRTPEPAIRRWLEFQQFALGTRYRYIRSSADVVTSNHQQYREQIRVRFNIDRAKRFTINAGFFTGSTFIGSWNTTGLGTGDFDGHDQYMRQFFVSAAPVAGIEGQFGGLYPNRGENTEYTSYDDDGYLVGGRVSIRRPKPLHLDEVSVTVGTLASTSTPNVWRRWDDLNDTNYTQLMATKRFSQLVSGSLDYTHLASTDTVRGAVALRFRAGAPLSVLRYEQYIRMSGDDAEGFSVTAERGLPHAMRAIGGYTTIDERYGGLNADRIQRGRRFYGLFNFPIKGPVTASIFATRALQAPYSLTNKVRLDAVVTWDVLASLRATGKF